MALGQKRICQSCGAKFYDLEKDPIKCPKCTAVFDPEVVNKPKRGRKKAVAAEEAEKSDDIEIDLDDDSVEIDEEVAEDAEEDIRDDMEIEDDNDEIDKSEDDVLIDIDDDADADIIDEADEKNEKE